MNASLQIKLTLITGRIKSFLAIDFTKNTSVFS